MSFAPQEQAIRVRDLRMRYGQTDVLHSVDLHAERGEVLVLLGPNGAGKTTTIEILEGFRRRSAGEVEVLGTDPEHGDEAWRSRLGIVLQSWRDHGRWRVRELLDQLARYYTPYRSPYPTDELLGLTGLTGQADSPIGKLSGGQRRRLDVAVGITGRPDLLFLDEPTVGFDPQARQDFHELVRRLDTTVLLTTHDLDEAEKLADRILILVAGRIVADGTAAELAARVSSRATVRYRIDGSERTETVADATAFVRELFARETAPITELEVRRPSLADVYLSLVRDFESGALQEAPAELVEVGA